MVTENNKVEEKKEEKAGIYTEDKQVILNHLKQSASRLMKAKFNGSATMAKNCLEMASQLETVPSEPKPEPVKRPVKK